MTEATVLDFEIMVMEQYLNIAKLILKAKQAKGLNDFREEERLISKPAPLQPGQLPWREKFIATYRSSHMKIVQD